MSVFFPCERHRRSFEVVIWVACVRLLPGWRCRAHIPMGGVDPNREDRRRSVRYPLSPKLGFASDSVVHRHSMSAVRTIVVGCGEPKKSMGWFHLQQLAVNPKAELLAVVEPW